MAKYQGRIFQEIEQVADYNPPGLYDLLTFHNSVFGTQPDSTADEFATTFPGSYIPLTAASLPDRTKILPFVVGLLPPATNITGRLLDRSRSLPTAGVLPTTSGAGNTAGAGQPPSVNAKGERQLNEEGRAFIKKAEGFKEYLYDDLTQRRWVVGGPNVGKPTIGYGYLVTKPDEIKKYADQGITEPEASLQFEKKIVGYETSVNLRLTAYANDNQYAAFVSFCYNLGNANGPIAAFNDGGGVAATDNMSRYVNVTVNGKRVLMQGLVNRRKHEVELFNKPVPNGSPVGSEVDKGPLPPSWQSSGANNAQKAQQSQTQSAGTSVNNPDLGLKYMAAQASLVKALQIAVAQAAATPPLKLLVNPESFKVSSQKIISDGNWGRNGAGTGLEHWGDAQDTISVSGKVAGFYAFPSESSQNPVAGGLSRAARNFSAAYQNFLSLFLIYRNNGGIWLEDFADAKDAQTVKPNNLALVGSIYIYYDSTMYIGSFDSFEMTESDVTPFTLSYSFSFTVRQTFLLDRIADNSKSSPSIPTNLQPIESNPASAPVAPPPIPPGGLPPASSLPDAPPGQFNGFGIEDRLGLPLSGVPTQTTKGAGMPLEGLDYLGTYTPR